MTALREWHLDQAVRVLQRGGVIAYPTEAVWGLGCDPNNPDAVGRLLALKGRPVAKGLIQVGSRVEQFAALLQSIEPALQARLGSVWPGPVTLLVPDEQDQVPVWIKGRHPQAAIRVSDHPLVAALCDKWGGPLVSTSANPANRSPARNSLAVRRYFADQLDYIIPGNLGGLKKPTVIRDLQTNRILRS